MTLDVILTHCHQVAVPLALNSLTGLVSPPVSGIGMEGAMWGRALPSRQGQVLLWMGEQQQTSWQATSARWVG
jgi:hypothetical protein